MRTDADSRLGFLRDRYAHAVTDLIACSLDGHAQRERLAAWRKVLANAERAEAITEGSRYLFVASDDIEARVRELAAAEHVCCPFLQFSVARVGKQVEMMVTAPPHKRDALRFIFGL
jgi:hypothetical protein